MNTPFDTLQAVNICEGIEEVDSDEEVIAAWQHLIDTGVVWQLQGSFGRQAEMLIETGVCTLPDHYKH